MSESETPALTVKEKYADCKGFECPRLLSLMKEREDGTPYFVEGDMAYYAMTLCNNWGLGLSNGDCPVLPLEGEVIQSSDEDESEEV